MKNLSSYENAKLCRKLTADDNALLDIDGGSEVRQGAVLREILRWQIRSQQLYPTNYKAIRHIVKIS